MQPLSARSPSPERAPGKEAGNAERAVNLVRTFPGLPEVAADLASQQQPAPPPAVGLRRIPWPEDQSWNAFQTAHAGGGRKTKVDWLNATAALSAARPPPLPSQADENWWERENSKRERKNLMAREREKRTRALGREERKAILKTELESVAQQPPPTPPPAPPPPSFLQEPLPDITQPPLQQQSFQPPPSLQAPNFPQEPLPSQARKTRANNKTNAKAALDEAKRKAMLGTELESVVQQPPPQAPPAAAEDAGRAGDDDDAGEDVFYWLYRQPRKRERPADAGPECKHDDAFLQQQPRKRGRPKGKGSAGAARHACAAPSEPPLPQPSEPLPGIKQPPLPQPSFQPPPSLRPLPRSDLWTIVDMYGLG